MTIICTACGHQIRLEESKIPAKPFRVKCAACGNFMSVSPVSESPAQPEPARAATNSPNFKVTEPPPGENGRTSTPGSVAVDSDLRQEVSEIRNDILSTVQLLLQGKQQQTVSRSTTVERTALICLQDSLNAEEVAGILRSIDYSVEIANTPAAALEKLDSQLYHIILIEPSYSDDKEGGRRIILKLNTLKAAQRRQVLVFLTSPNQKTFDGKNAFLNGVNLTIQQSDLKDLPHFIQLAEKENDTLYSLFNRLSATSEKTI